MVDTKTGPRVPQAFVVGLKHHFNAPDLTPEEALIIKDRVQAEFGNKPGDRLTYKEVLRMVVAGEDTHNLLEQARQAMRERQGIGTTQPDAPTVEGVQLGVGSPPTLRRSTESQAFNRIEGGR